MFEAIPLKNSSLFGEARTGDGKLRPNEQLRLQTVFPREKPDQLQLLDLPAGI